MKIPKIDMQDNETGCCPRFHPEAWEDRVFTLKDEMFVKARSRSILYMPLNLGKVMAKAMTRMDGAGVIPEDTYLILSKDVSPWACDHHFMVTGPVNGMDTVDLTGDYYVKTYDGPFKMMPDWIKDFRGSGKSKGYDFQDLMYFYTTCPKCAKHYGHNYVVLFGKLN